MTVRGVLEIDFEINCMIGVDSPSALVSAGKPQTVRKQVDSFLDGNRMIRVKYPADVVIVSCGGKPFDRTLFSSLDPLLSNEAMVKKKGAAVLVAACEEDYGPQDFYELMREHLDGSELSRKYSRRPDIVTLKALFATSFLSDHELITVSTLPDYYVHHVFKMRSSKTAASALLSAERSLEDISSVVVLRHGYTFSTKALAESHS